MSSLTNSMINVLHLDHTTESGGAEMGLARILGVQNSWHATVVLPRTADGAEGPFGAVSDLRLRKVRVGPIQRAGASSASMLSSIRFMISMLLVAVLIRLSRSFRASDVIHANTSRSAVYGAIACTFSRKPLVVHLRDEVSAESLGRLGWAAFSKLALRRATAVIGNSQWTLNSALPFIDEKCLRFVVPSASGIEPVVSSVVNDQVTRIGMVARIDPWKGQRLLLHAFSSLENSGEIQLLFAGSAQFGHSDYLSELRGVVNELDMGDRVKFFGHVGNVAEFIESLDICIHSSLRPEPLGQNILQYLAAGKPVIAANAGGPAEWINPGINGLLFETGNVEALGQCIDSLVKDREMRNRLSQAAFQTPGLLTDREVADSHGDIFLRVFQEST